MASTVTAPTKEALMALYANTLRTSRSFASYNFRQYFIQRTQANFRSIQAEQDSTRVTKFYEEKMKELDVLKRAASLNQMYGGRKLVVETKEELPPPNVFERGDS